MAIIPIVLIALLIVGAFAFVLHPLFTEYPLGKGEGNAHQPSVGTPLLPGTGRVALTVDELVARRDAIYAALKDAEFDRETGKLTDKDHQIVRARYMKEAAQVLRQLDRLTPEAEAALDAEIESAVAKLRSDGQSLSPGVVEAVEAEVSSLARRAAVSDRRGSACPNCGQPYQPGDVFCAHCGTSLANTCPECGASHQPGDAFCAHCGTPLADEVGTGN